MTDQTEQERRLRFEWRDGWYSGFCCACILIGVVLALVLLVVP